MIEIAVRVVIDCVFANALLDFNGTLAHDGRLIDDVAERLRSLAVLLDLHVVTGDTPSATRWICC